MDQRHFEESPAGQPPETEAEDGGDPRRRGTDGPGGRRNHGPDHRTHAGPAPTPPYRSPPLSSYIQRRGPCGLVCEAQGRSVGLPLTVIS